HPSSLIPHPSSLIRHSSFVIRHSIGRGRNRYATIQTDVPPFERRVGRRSNTTHLPRNWLSKPSEFMRSWIVAIVAIGLMCGTACLSQAAEPVGTPPTWSEIRETGRAKSLFLKEAGKQEAGKQPQSKPAVPTPSLDVFR